MWLDRCMYDYIAKQCRKLFCIWDPRMHTGCRLGPPDTHGVQAGTPGCTRGAGWDPQMHTGCRLGPTDAHLHSIFMSKPIMRTK